MRALKRRMDLLERQTMTLGKSPKEIMESFPPFEGEGETEYLIRIMSMGVTLEDLVVASRESEE